MTGFAGADGGVDNRTDQAARNLPLAAGLGAAAVPATDLVSLIFGRFSPLLTRDPVARGDEMLVRSMARDEQTPEQIAQAVEAAQAAGQSEYRAVDAAGRNSQRVGAMAAKTPGPARNDISQTLAARQQEQGQRIGSYVDDALGAQGPDAYATEQGIVNARRTAAQPLYDEAYKAPAPQGAFYDETLGRQSVQDAIRSAEKVAAEKQIPISDMFTEVPNPNPTKTQVLTGLVDPNGNPIMRTEVSDETIRVPTVRGWDLIKRELDAKVNQLYKAGDTTAAEAVKETRNALRGQLSTDVPKYGEALAKYADDSTSLEAIQTGRDLINARNADEAKASMRDIPENKRDLPRIGAAREIGVKLENQRAGQDKTLSFDTPNMQGKLDVLVDDPLVRAIFNQRLMRERDMVRAGRALTGGSSTYENLVDGQAVGDAGSALTALLSGNIMRAAGLAGGHALGALSRAATGMNEETATHVGQRLLSNDPQEIRSLADLFRQVQDHVHAPSLTPAVGSAGLNAPRTGNSDDRRGR
ncbi:hypothetical protein [Xaviernesmea oryzae]|uniref:hypothetical protein n=1 Tax=Xaviernesmea oryzae TaxID=464029 RepID=UPI0011134A2B|nr:hypothetical protein [Xaviernesmea oryzae]